MTIGVIIADDEPLTRRAISRLLEPHPLFEVHAECGDGISTVKAIAISSPDVIFLDVQMPGFDGLRVVSEVGLDKMPLTVFVTAHSQYAIQAFEGRAVDYLLKPFGQVRFEETLKRIERRFAIEPLSTTPNKTFTKTPPDQMKYLECIPVSHNGQIRPLRVEEVDWIQAEKNYVLLHVGDRVEVIRRTLNSLAEVLDPRAFLRIHRSTIVNVDKISEVQPWQNGYHTIKLQSGKLLRMSRYQHESARLLKGRAGAVRKTPVCLKPHAFEVL